MSSQHLATKLRYPMFVYVRFLDTDHTSFLYYCINMDRQSVTNEIDLNSPIPHAEY